MLRQFILYKHFRFQAIQLFSSNQQINYKTQLSIYFSHSQFNRKNKQLLLTHHIEKTAIKEVTKQPSSKIQLQSDKNINIWDQKQQKLKNFSKEQYANELIQQSKQLDMIKKAQEFIQYIIHIYNRNRVQKIIRIIQKKYSELKQIKSQKKRIQFKKLIYRQVSKIMLQSIKSNFEKDRIKVEYLIDILKNAEFSSITYEKLQQLRIRFNIDSKPIQFNQKFTPFSDIANFNNQIYDHPQLYEVEQIKQNKKIKSKSAFQIAIKIRNNLANVNSKMSKFVIKRQAKQKNQFEDQFVLAPKYVIFEKKQKLNDINLLEECKKYVYIYGMPYNISKQECHQLIQFLGKKIQIQIQLLSIFNYKDYVERTETEEIFIIPQQFEINSNQTKPIIRQFVKKGQQFKKNTKSGLKLDKSEIFIKKMTEQRNSHYNKSSMVIKFSSVDDKKKILIPEARLFGLNFRRFKNIKLEEGFAKNTITLVNIPWGVDSKYLESELNDLFKPLGIEITYPKCILEKNYIYIKFDYITEALAAIKLLDNFTFQNKKIKSQLTSGSCLVSNSYYNLDIENQWSSLKQKIKEKNEQWKIKFQRN